MLSIVITVDVEGVHGSCPFSDLAVGNLRGESERWGAERIAQLLDDYGLAGTFFLDVYETSLWGEEEVKELAVALHEMGQDVQLHTHPSWRDDPRDQEWLRRHKASNSWLSQDKDFMSKLTVAEQSQVLLEGKNLLESWLGRPCVVHRSGGYAVNRETLDALSMNGFYADASVNRAHSNTQIYSTSNAVVELGGVLEMPVSVMNLSFRLPVIGTIYSKLMKLDIDSSTQRELKHAVESAQKSKLGYLSIFMHSYSLLRMNNDFSRLKPNRRTLTKFDTFLKFLVNQPEVRVVTAAELVAEYLDGEPLPTWIGSDVIPEMRANSHIATLGVSKLWRKLTRH